VHPGQPGPHRGSHQRASRPTDAAIVQFRPAHAARRADLGKASSRPRRARAGPTRCARAARSRIGAPPSRRHDRALRRSRGGWAGCPRAHVRRLTGLGLGLTVDRSRFRVDEAIPAREEKEIHGRRRGSLASKSHRLSRRTLMRLACCHSATRCRSAVHQPPPKDQAGREPHRKLEGAEGRHRSPSSPELQGSPAARGAGQGGEASARPGADRQDPSSSGRCAGSGNTADVAGGSPAPSTL